MIQTSLELQFTFLSPLEKHLEIYYQKQNQHIFICLYLIYISSLFNISCPILHWVFCLLLSFKITLYILYNNPLSDMIFFLQIFSPSLWLVFSFSWHYLSHSTSIIEVLVLMKSSSSIIYFMDFCFWCCL